MPIKSSSSLLETTFGSDTSSVSSSSDGSVLFLASYGYRVYLSTDFGVTWNEKQPKGDISCPWRVTACDSDGSVLIVGGQETYLYVSTNGGSSWNARDPMNWGDPSPYSWRNVVCSSDGSVIVAVDDYGGRINRSRDSGVTWDTIYPPGMSYASWYSIACDADGSTIVGGVFNDRLWITVNGTDTTPTWTESRPIGDIDGYWSCVACNETGSVIVAGTQPGRIYISFNIGSSWDEIRPDGDFNYGWCSLYCSRTGNTLAAVSQSSDVYMSKNSGSSWNNVASMLDKLWICVTGNYNGTLIVASTYNSSGSVYVYKFEDSFVPNVTVV